MKLLNVHTGEIHEFLSDTDVEPYAILSHTWAEDEVTFEDLQSLPKETLAAKKGFAKIYHCCVQAAADGYGWAWVDTCCIDKRSSAELSEAINCMFRWYKNAAICYVYFADVQAHATGLGDIHHELACARWFTRGWTLQELLASREMVLYSRDWKRIGTKHDLAINLAWITGIEVKYLRGVVSLATASVSKRMSWAAQRSTSRTEDIAYCLLGIFDINMPLLYGEGKKAFRRLQEEILKANPADHTLLAWGRIVSCPPMRWVDDAPQLYGYKYIPWDEAEASQTLRGLFAESPKDFQHSAGLLPLPRAGGRYDSSLISLNRPMTPAVYPTITGAGVMLELFVLRAPFCSVVHWPKTRLTQLRPVHFALLHCEDTRSGTPAAVLLPLYPWGMELFGRMDELLLSRKGEGALAFGIKKSLKIEPQRHRGPQQGDFLIRLWGNGLTLGDSLGTYHPSVNHIASEGIVEAPVSGVTGKLWSIHFQLTPLNQRFGFAIVFERLAHNGPGVGSVAVSLVPLLINEPKTEDFIDIDGILWTHKSNLGQTTPWWPDEPHQGHGCRMVRSDPPESRLGRPMALPLDTWRVDVKPFPLIEVRVERLTVSFSEGDTIDIVDIAISPDLKLFTEPPKTVTELYNRITSFLTPLR